MIFPDLYRSYGSNYPILTSVLLDDTKYISYSIFSLAQKKMIDCIHFKIEKLRDDLKKKMMDRSGKINRAKLINQIHYDTVFEQNLAKASKLVASSAADHVFFPSPQDWKRSTEKALINKRSDEEDDVDGSDTLPPIDDQELLLIRTNAVPL